MKIFLGNAPWYRDSLRGIRAGSRWPHLVPIGSMYKPFPFYLAYSASLLSKNRFEILVVDALAEETDRDAYFERLEKFQPDIIVHEVATASFKFDLENGRMAKERVPNAKLIFCGAHSDIYNTEFLTNTLFVDFVIVGEYEFALLELAKSIRNGTPLSDVAGIIYRDGGTVHKTDNRLLGNLDDLPWPDRENLPIEKYRDNPFEMPSPSLQIHTSRGCPFTCTFCVWPQIMYGGNKYRFRSADDIVDEIVYCKNKFGFKSFYIDDDTFNIGKKRIIEFCDELIKRKIGLVWSAMARADTADDEMLLKMKEAGLVSIKYGIESGDQAILDSIGKKLDLEKAKDTIKKTKALGIKFHLTFLFGLPGETMETAQKTIALADELNPDSLQFSIVTPFPGSKLYFEMQEKGFLLSNDFDDYDGNNRAVIRTESLSPEDLEEILRSASLSWHRKTFIKKLWNNKLYYTKEFLRNPAGYLKMFYKTVITGR